MPDVIADERRNEKVAVVVAFMHAQFERVTGIGTRIAQQFRFELFFKKAIGEALIDK